MTDEKPKKRPWFQLHLSTCVVLMVVAGVLIWANLTIRRGPIYSEGVDYNAAVKDWAESNNDSFSATFCQECLCEGVAEQIKALEAELKAKCGDKKNGKLVDCIGSVLNDPKIRPSFK